MKKRPIWRAVFSQSGSEIYQVSKILGRFPDSIITNKPVERVSEINPNLVAEAFERLVFVPRSPTNEEYMTALGHADIVTLHGYLRILPSIICYRYLAYNGHPGLITSFPELKGKDPQKKVWDSNDKKYDNHGHVIHKVITEVDAGTMLSMTGFLCDDIHKEYGTLDNYIAEIHKYSVKNWVNFLKSRV